MHELSIAESLIEMAESAAGDAGATGITTLHLRIGAISGVVQAERPGGTLVVAAVGPGVKHLREGDPVIVQPSGFCGLCSHCRVGNTHYCEHAFTTGGDGPEDVWPGAFAEYMRTRENTLFAKPDSISFDAAALTEPLSGAWKGVIQYSEMQVGDDVVVIGTGGIGLLCLMVAKAAGRIARLSPAVLAECKAGLRRPTTTFLGGLLG
mgnify:CR=1 FL=1